MISLEVIVGSELSDERAQVILAERNDAPQTLGLDRAHEAFGVSVQVWATRWKSYALDAAVGEHEPGRGREHGVSVHDEVSLAEKEPVDGVGEISRDLLHPGFVGVVDDASDLDTPGLASVAPALVLRGHA